MRLPTLALAALLAATPAVAAETAVPLAARGGLAITLYADGFALVADHRRAALAKGANTLAFEGISPRMVPSSALLRAGDGVRVLEQNFDFDLISPKALLARSVGGTVRVVRTNPTTGEETVETATVLAIDGGTVLRIGDRIETGVPGRLVFDRVPEGLRVRPALLIDVDSGAAGEVPLDLTYLTEGLGWRAEYAAEIDAAGKTLDLGGWASLTNATGTAFEAAEAQLVAGDVRREAVRPVAMLKAANMAEAASAPVAMRAEAVGDVHVYTLPRPVTLLNNQTKQVALLSAAAVPVERLYVRERWVQEAAGRGQADPPATERPDVVLTFRNVRESGLGVPLPAGLVRVYERDSRGRALFAGERSVNHTAPDEPVTFHLGQAVDIGVQYAQTAFTTDGLPAKAFETAQAITVTNAKAEAVRVRLVERFPGAVHILQESKARDAFAGNEAAWVVDVAAGGKATLAYRARVQRPR